MSLLLQSDVINHVMLCSFRNIVLNLAIMWNTPILIRHILYHDHSVGYDFMFLLVSIILVVFISIVAMTMTVTCYTNIVATREYYA